MEQHVRDTDQDDIVTLTRADLTKLEETVHTVELLSQTVADLQTKLRQCQETISKMPTYEILVHMQQRLHTLEMIPRHPVSQVQESEPDIADAEYFSGERHKLTNFLSQCKLKFVGQKSKFQTETAKIMYAGSRLRGFAYTWFEPILDSESGIPKPEMTSFKAFSDSLTAMYGNPDKQATAERQISECRQLNSAAAYAADFRRLQAIISWNDAALRHQFYSGLKDNVKDKLAESERPDNLDELITLAIRIDNRLHERKLEKYVRSNTSASTKPSLHTTPSAPPPPTTPAWKPSALATQPMELDSSRSRFRKLTEEEKKRRRAQNLCLYCGKSGHSTNDCPSIPKFNVTSQHHPNISELSVIPYESPFTVQSPTNDPGHSENDPAEE